MTPHDKLAKAYKGFTGCRLTAHEVRRLILSDTAIHDSVFRTCDDDGTTARELDNKRRNPSDAPKP